MMRWLYNSPKTIQRFGSEVNLLGRTYIYLKYNIIPYPLRESFKSPFPHILRESFKSPFPHILRESFKSRIPLILRDSFKLSANSHKTSRA